MRYLGVSSMTGNADCSEDAMTRLVAYSGTNHRLRRVLAKMRAGKPFTVAAVGGSVTIGHGLDWEYEDSMYKETNMHRVLFDHLDKKFPSVKPAVLRRSGKGVANAFINAGQAARGRSRSLRRELFGE